MAIAVFYSDSPDYKIAYEIKAALEKAPRTSFRDQLLDVIETNAEEVFGRKGQDND